MNENNQPQKNAGSPLIAEARLRVRYAETDGQGVVYHANYIVWFEVARGEYCRAIGYPYTQIEADGYGFMVTDIGIKYYSPTRYDDEILVRVWMEKLGRASCVFGYQVYNETVNKLAVEGMTKHVAVTREGKIVPVGAELYRRALPHIGRGPSRFVLKD